MVRWTRLFTLLALAAVSQVDSSVQLRAGHPYQDRFFTLDSQPLHGGSGLVYSSALQQESGAVASGTCNGAGGNCPRPTNAKLQLWVPDEATVYIGGQRTKPQSLGGVHKNSRIYTLEGLVEVAKQAEIVVELCDVTGHLTRMQKQIFVQAGERLEVRYPVGFIALEMPEPMEEGESIPQVHYGHAEAAPIFAAPMNKAPSAAAVPVVPAPPTNPSASAEEISPQR